MLRTAVAAFALTAFVLPAAQADAPKPTAKGKLSGTYTRSVGDHEIAFEFAGELLNIRLKTAGGDLKAVCDYGMTKDGVLFGILSKVEANGIEAPEAGTPFSFKVDRKDGEIVVSDLKGASEAAKGVIEGTYKLEKK